MTAQPGRQGAASGFFYPGGGMMNQLALRNYDSESLADLEPLHELVNGIVSGHKMLVPGKLYPMLTTWRDELASVIETKSAEKAEREAAGQREEGQARQDGRPPDRHAETGHDRNAGP